MLQTRSAKSGILSGRKCVRCPNSKKKKKRSFLPLNLLQRRDEIDFHSILVFLLLLNNIDEEMSRRSGTEYLLVLFPSPNTARSINNRRNSASLRYRPLPIWSRPGTAAVASSVRQLEHAACEAMHCVSWHRLDPATCRQQTSGHLTLSLKLVGKEREGEGEGGVGGR